MEENLLGNGSDSDESTHSSRYFKDWFNDQDSKDALVVEPEEQGVQDESESNVLGNLRTSAVKSRRSKCHRKLSEKHEKRKEKEPVCPTGFRGIMSSISMAGQGETVACNKHLQMPTSVRIGRGNNIPHGMKFAAGNKNHNRRKGGWDRPSSDKPSDSGSSTDNHRRQGRPRCSARLGK